MDILQTYLSPQGTTVPPCPRTHGAMRLLTKIYLHSLPVMRIAHLDTTLNVRPLTKHVITMATYIDTAPSMTTTYMIFHAG
jgi:hypothetical protein